MTANQRARCPRCAGRADGATDAFRKDATPSPGDVAICAYCCAINMYTPGMLLQPASDDVVAEAVAQLKAAGMLAEPKFTGGMWVLRAVPS